MSEVLKAIESIGGSIKAMNEATDQKYGELKSRLELLESAHDRPGKPGSDDSYSREQNEHKGVFCEWLRKPLDGHTKRRLEEAQHEMKAVTVGTPSAGGYAVPEIIAREIERRVALQNPFRSLVRVIQVGSRDFKQLVSSNDLASGWVGEGDARSETGTSRLFERAPSFGTVYAYPKASEESVQDIFFDVGNWLIEEAVDGFASAEAVSIVSGNGTSKPTGFLNTPPTSATDSGSPERPAGTLQYVPIAAAGSSPFTVAGFGGNDLINLQMEVHERFLMDAEACAWVMRRSTLAHVRKLKTTDGQYLLQPGLAQGAPPTLLGYPVFTTDAMPANSSGNNPVAFGNWRRGYLLADRVGTMEITVDSNITTPGQVKYYMRRVVGGTILNHQAIKTLKVAMS